ncbi:hypothetical protein BC829DRAFT_399383, partial [Chytridium lagenaria]
MHIVSIVSSVILATAAVVSAQTTTTQTAYSARCGDNQANALTEANGVTFADVPTSCTSQSFSQVASFSCMCRGVSGITIFCSPYVDIRYFVNSACSADPLFSTVSGAVTSNCQAALQLAAAPTSPATGLTTGAPVVTGTVAPAVQTTTKKNAGSGVDSKAAMCG